MPTYFANFVKSGDPNGPGLPAWPPANRSSEVQVLHIDVRTRAEPDAHDRRYRFLDEPAAKKAD
jgi:para-nitrobenzyl esterase